MFERGPCNGVGINGLLTDMAINKDTNVGHLIFLENRFFTMSNRIDFW